MNVAVSGGAGFIGSHVVDLLVARGHQVVVVDDLSHGKRDNLNPKASFFEEDIRGEGLGRLFQKQKIEGFIHLAAQINARASMEDPLHDASENIMGSLNVLEHCRRHGVKKIVFSSSVAVYGEPAQLPCREDDSSAPINNYGISKRCVEEYLRLYEAAHGLECVAMRYSNVYGPRQDPRGEAGVVSIFIDRLLGQKTPLIFGDGNQTREFVFVEDVALATILALEKKTKSRIFNISSDTRISVNELLFALKKIVGSDIGHRNESKISGEIRHMGLDITLAKKELGWRPGTDLALGLKKTVDFFREKDLIVSA